MPAISAYNDDITGNGKQRDIVSVTVSIQGVSVWILVVLAHTKYVVNTSAQQQSRKHTEQYVHAIRNSYAAILVSLPTITTRCVMANPGVSQLLDHMPRWQHSDNPHNVGADTEQCHQKGGVSGLGHFKAIIYCVEGADTQGDSDLDLLCSRGGGC